MENEEIKDINELEEKEMMKNLEELIYNCNCYLEDKENCEEEVINWFQMEKDTINSLLSKYQREKKNINEFEMEKVYKALDIKEISEEARIDEIVEKIEQLKKDRDFYKEMCLKN